MPKPSHGRAALNAAAFTFLVTLALPHAQAASTATASLSNIQFKVSDRLLSDGVEPSFVFTPDIGNNLVLVNAQAEAGPPGAGPSDKGSRTVSGDFFRPLSQVAQTTQSGAEARASDQSFVASGSANALIGGFASTAKAYAYYPYPVSYGSFFVPSVQLAPHSRLDVTADASVFAWAACGSAGCSGNDRASAEAWLGVSYDNFGFGAGSRDSLTASADRSGPLTTSKEQRLTVSLVNDSDRWLLATLYAGASVEGRSASLVASIPEPATTGLMALGLVAVCAAAKRQRKRLPASLAA